MFIGCTRNLLLACGVAVALQAALGPANAAPQGEAQKNQQYRVLITDTPEPPPSTKFNAELKLLLRPSVQEQPAYLWLINTQAGAPTTTVEVALAGAVGQPPRVLLTGSVAKAESKKPMLVTLKPVATGGPTGAKEGKDAKGPPPWPNLGDPPFKIVVLVSDTNNKKESFDVPFRIEHPSQYVAPPDVEINDKRQLKVRLKLDKEAALPKGAGVPVALELQPALLPGLLPQSLKAGTFRSELTAKRKQVVLSADHVEFKGGVPPAAGRIFVTADTYARAFAYTGTFAAGTPDKLDANPPRVRIIMPRYHAGTDTLLVPLQVDADPTRNLRVEVAFDEAATNDYTVSEVLPSYRAQLVQYNTGAKGALLFKVRVQDWVAPIKTAGIFGRRSIRVRLLGADGNPVELTRETDLEKGTLLFSARPDNPFARLSYDEDPVSALFAEVVIDGSAPVVALVEPQTNRVTPGTKFRPRAKIPRTAEQAPLAEVVFYLGDPVKDGEPLPKNAIASPGVFEPDTGLWVPRDKFIVPAPPVPGVLSPILVNVRATTVVGLQGSDAMRWDIELPPPPKVLVPVKKFATIKGQITRGTLPQPKAKVVLMTDKAAIKASSAVDKDGKYVFKDVPPGTYVIYASEPAVNLAGSAVITVPEVIPDPIPPVDIALIATK